MELQLPVMMAMEAMEDFAVNQLAPKQGGKRMRSDHQLDAPTGADGCVGPEHQGLSRRKAGCWGNVFLSSEDSDANQL